jgi:NAD(P)-dependent dehydrogenase (short-subunit alcohol dehydrogenase family)
MSRPAEQASALRGRVAIVTGGARALGLDSSLALGTLGATVLVADDHGTDEAVEKIRAIDGEAMAVDVNPCDTTAMDRLVLTAVEQFGRVDILVNAAGEVERPVATRWNEIANDAWTSCVATQAKTVWLGCRAVAATMKQQQSGRIVNVGSSAVLTGTPGYLPYVTAKSALLGVTRSIARELGPFNIAVNMIYPEPQAADEASFGGRVVPEPSLGSGPVDLTGTLAFLCGDGVDFITGQSWILDRGRVLQ